MMQHRRGLQRVRVRTVDERGDANLRHLLVPIVAHEKSELLIGLNAGAVPT